MTRAPYMIAIIAGLTLTGCAGDPWGPSQTAGTVVGGVTGGLLGSAVGGTAATAIGAALGAVIGSEIGRQLDEASRQRAYYAAEEAFASGRPTSWESPDSPARGRVVPSERYRYRNDICRDFTHTIWVDGRREVIEGTACEMADGSWRIVA